ncbi:MAG: bifunctional phosphopantothenoylcysteine decarboxylase/phosphopantothenate--cysteine ligase CoaBC [Halodesulfurarchaeum sp.]
MLEGTNVVLGVTGSVAAVTVVELVHELRRQGATVRAFMTEAAEGIVHPDAVEYATGAPVVTELSGAVEHVDYCGIDGWGDVCLVAPATANTIGKIGGGIDDTPVTTAVTTALGADTPVVVAPAMHEGMFDHPAVGANLDTLKEWGVSIVPPRIEEGKAKIASAEAIALETARASSPSELADTNIVVTSGATAEPIDPVRVLTNRASGRTGRAIAKALYVRGAAVTLIHDGSEVPYAEVETVLTAAEMTTAALDYAETADVLISAAAISDFTVEPAAEKLDSGRSQSLELQPVGKLIEAVTETYPALPIVAFKLESDAEYLLEAARELRDRLDLPLVVANHVESMGGSTTAATLVTRSDTRHVEGSKADLGRAVAESLVDVLQS